MLPRFEEFVEFRIELRPKQHENEFNGKDLT